LSDEQAAGEVHGTLRALRAEIARRIVGHDDVIDGVIACLLTGGHVLLEGVPGLGKTQLVKTLASAMELSFSRIQFTPDLMPADITGTQILAQSDDGERRFRFQPGPVFAHILLADEINRATPKTQSALLEAMEERSVTVGRDEHVLEEPFMVLATQNPIEMEGTYPLPEAQLDRFALKLNARFPNARELATIVERTTGEAPPAASAVMTADDLARARAMVREVVLAHHVRDYAIALVLATHPDSDNATDAVKRYVAHGASPRGLMAIIMTAKVSAFMEGRLNVSFDDVNATVVPALRHRILLNFEGEADGVPIDDMVDELIAKTALTTDAIA
jgi:MoxR-like ATPase